MYWRRQRFARHERGKQKTGSVGKWYPEEECGEAGEGLTPHAWGTRREARDWDWSTETMYKFSEPREPGYWDDNETWFAQRWMGHDTHENHHVRAQVRVGRVSGVSTHGANKTSTNCLAIVDTGATVNVVTEKLRTGLGAKRIAARRPLRVTTGGDAVLVLTHTCVLVVDGRKVVCWISQAGPERLILGLPYIRAQGVDLNKLFLAGAGSKGRSDERAFLNYMARSTRLEADSPESTARNRTDTDEGEEVLIHEAEAAKVVAARERLGDQGEHAKAVGKTQSGAT